MNRCARRPGVSIRGCAFVLFASVLAAACAGESSAERVTLGYEAAGMADELPPELQLHLDAGNDAYRARDYDVALQHFRDVVTLDPQLAAGWYGIAMVQSALGNAAAADSARGQVHRLAPELPLEHPVAAAPPNPHPQPGVVEAP